MDDRGERVRVAHTYFLEYLKLMNHYELLEKPIQVKAWKALYKKHLERQKRKTDDDDKGEDQNNSGNPAAMHPMMALQ